MMEPKDIIGMLRVSPATDFAELEAQVAALPEEWKAAVEFLAGNDLASLACGRHEITSGGTFANVSEYTTKTESKYEAHREYIDIQVAVSGEEEIMVAPIGKAGAAVSDYNASSDIEFFADAADAYAVRLDPSVRVVLFPKEAHMPGIAVGGRPSFIRKIVIKVPYSK